MGLEQRPEQHAHSPPSESQQTQPDTPSSIKGAASVIPESSIDAFSTETGDAKAHYMQALRNRHPELTEVEVRKHAEIALSMMEFSAYLETLDFFDEEVIRMHPEWNWQRWYERD
jgi:hypothetical protein